MIVEYEGNSWEDYPDPNYNPNKVDSDEKLILTLVLLAHQIPTQFEKIIYIEDNFISPSQCQEIINYTNESLGIMTAVGHSEDTIPTFEPQEDYYDFAEHHARQDEILDDANYQGHADF